MKTAISVLKMPIGVLNFLLIVRGKKFSLVFLRRPNAHYDRGNGSGDCQ